MFLLSAILPAERKKGQFSNLCVYEQTHFKVYSFYAYDLTYMEYEIYE